MDQPTPTPSEPILSWNAPSVPLHERSVRWYLIAITLLIAGVIYGIWSGAWSFSVVLILCAVVYVLVRNHVPPAHTITISREGILFDTQFTRFEDIAGFWFIETAHYNEIRFVLKDRKAREIAIHTDGIPLDTIRSSLNGFCSELSDKHEHLIDIFIRLCKL